MWQPQHTQHQKKTQTESHSKNQDNNWIIWDTRQLIKYGKTFHLLCECCDHFSKYFVDANLYSPTIWPLTVSLSLGLSLFKSSLWSMGREITEAKVGTMKQLVRITMKEQKREKESGIHQCQWDACKLKYVAFFSH